MLAETDRGGIRDSVIQWSQRKNIPDEVLNDFIEIAMSKSNRALRIPPLETFSVEPIDALGYIAIPSNFLEAKELKMQIGDDWVLLERKAIHEVDSISNTSSSSSGRPCVFGRFGNFLRIAPWTGDDTSSAVLYYYSVIPVMTADTDTNWFTQYAPELLLYGALSELASYTRDTEATQLWGAKFNELVNTIQQVENRAEWEGSSIGVTLAGSTRLGR